MLMIVMESEFSFANLQMAMVKAEHTAIVSEDAGLLKKSITEYWARFVAFCTKVWASIVAWIKNVLAKLSVIWVKVSGFLKRNSEALAKAKRLIPAGTKVSVWSNLTTEKVEATMKSAVHHAKDAANAANGEGKSMTMAEVASKFGEEGPLGSVVSNLVKGEKKEIDLNAGLIDMAVKDIETYNAKLSLLKDLNNAAQTFFKEAISIANKAAKEAEEKSERSKQRVQAENFKTAGQAINIVCSVMANAQTAMAAQSISILRAALRGTSKAAGEEGQEKKAQDKVAKGAKKEDSILADFGLI
jgi:hypothetical protein